MRTGYSYMRFSSAKQRKGGSIDRQQRRVKEYCEANGIVLDTSLSYSDEAVSALKGANAKTGKLGEFLAACDEGLVDPNGVFLVDNLDRISREHFEEAGETIRKITKHLDVVTLSDGKVYKKGKTDVLDAIMIILIMSRANEEVNRKIELINAAYKTKRKKVMAGGHIMTSQVPFWLKLNDAKDGFDLLPDKIELVKKAFKYSEAGLGTRRIMLKLNEEGYKTARGKGWNLSSMQLLLVNPAVIGHLVMRKSGVIQDVKTDYYPQVISPDLFNKLEAIRNKRGKGTSGPTGKGFRNILKGLIKCECGSSMNFINKGVDKRAKKSIKPYQTIRCRAAMQSSRCTAKHYKYEETESYLLTLLGFLDYGTMQSGATDTLQAEIGRFKKELIPMQKEMKKLVAFVVGNEEGEEEDDPATERYLELKGLVKVAKQAIKIKEAEVLTIGADYQASFDSLKRVTEEERTGLNRFLHRHIESIAFNKNVVTVRFHASKRTVMVDLTQPIHIEDLDEFNSGWEDCDFIYRVNLDEFQYELSS